MTGIGQQADRNGGVRGVVPGRRVRWSGETTRVAVPRQSADCEPIVELVREGGVVQAIDITCGCGKRMRLRCFYSDAAPPR